MRKVSLVLFLSLSLPLPLYLLTTFCFQPSLHSLIHSIDWNESTFSANQKFSSAILMVNLSTTSCWSIYFFHSFLVVVLFSAFPFSPCNSFIKIGSVSCNFNANSSICRLIQYSKTVVAMACDYINMELWLCSISFNFVFILISNADSRDKSPVRRQSFHVQKLLFFGVCVYI